ncbi:quinolinate synthase NadA [Flavobacterium cheniae]|uniref:Quinolinate synthase n=1 Tax=Flavobacterium cheniae TaxID=295428 RepID=A0A562KS26_9FLAO|nr:quinolinate synthase NadA [Flavobacterium cheniae]TDR25621.1 quinolinate synthetase [Flavobacterium cheniae]TWH98192.1 quinolinate synthetase [Flavobacterium cheniae]
MKTITDLKEKILALKKEKNAVILAHYYQEEAIQEIADFVGDSLELSRKASQVDADIIVFAGVYFMAETAKIVNPNKKVIVPDVKAGCSLADGCPPKEFKTFLEKYPNHTVVTYINCTAEIKTLTDIVCTSSNAKKVIGSIPEDQPIVFAPDKNLGKYLIAETGRDMVLWEGSCIVHEAFSLEKLIDLYKKHPTATIIAHPESETHILKVAHYIGSTSGMLNHVKNSTNDTFIVATEAGILHQMQLDNPTKTLIPAPSKEDNTCACSECAFMKVNTLEKLYQCLQDESPEVLLGNEIIEKALLPIQRMLALN